MNPLENKIAVRPTFVAMLICALSYPLQAQSVLEKKIVLKAEPLTVLELVEEIRRQTSAVISYGNTPLLNKRIKINVTPVTVLDVLKRIAAETGMGYKVMGSKIVLTKPVKKYTVSGYLRDGQSGENLIGGNVYSSSDHGGITTNGYGYYSLTLPADTTTLLFSYVGYETVTRRFMLLRDTVIDVGMSTSMLNAVVINAAEISDLQENTRMSAFDMPVSQLKALPAIIGETDIMKGLQLLPGVRAGDEGTSGLYVRGGGPDQNLILLDGVPVYNAAHMFGFFSVFNADAINHVELIKGGFPARYGGRLSSVIDISMKEGNREAFKGEGSFGLLASKLTFEGPLKKDKASFIVSARRTYLDLLARPFLKNPAGYFFGDLNTKINYEFSNRSRLYFSAYAGQDRGFSSSKSSHTNIQTSEMHIMSDNADIGWGNITSAMRWNYVIAPDLFANVTATFSRYRFKMLSEYERAVFEADGTRDVAKSTHLKSVYASSINDYALKADFDLTPTLKHYIRFGVYGIAHRFRPGASTIRASANLLQFSANKIDAVELGGYGEDDLTISKSVKANLGVHFSGFIVGQKTYSSIQPRISLQYRINKTLSLKSSYAQMIQYIHLLTNAGVGLPTDLWVPATSRVSPQKSVQAAIGLAYTPRPSYELTLEGYHKTMDGVIEYKDGAGFLNTRNDWQDKVVTGKGESYGAELFVQKKQGRWKGWLGYTLSWTDRSFDQINSGKRFPYRYDRRHDAEITFNYDVSKRTEFSLVWTYATGSPVTLPKAVYAGWYDTYGTAPVPPYEGNTFFEGRNNFRLRSCHRLDASLTFRKTKKWGTRSWVIGVYNAYNRINPFYADFKYDDKEGKRKLYQYGLIPVIPSISYNFKF